MTKFDKVLDITKQLLQNLGSGETPMLTTPIEPLEQTVTEPNYLAACNAAGLLIFNLGRQCWPDTWAAYDRLHDALGVPMQWSGARSLSEAHLTLTYHVGRVLRSLGQADILAVMATADREFRRARWNHAELLENDVKHLSNKIEDNRYAEGSRGWEDKASDQARLLELMGELKREREALSPKAKEQ